MISKRFLNDGQAVWELNQIQKDNLLLFNKKCAEGMYKWESFSCECGNATEFELLGKKDRYGLSVDTVICKCCGLIMTNPRMTEESYQEFYETEYPFIYRAIKNPDEDYFQRRVEYGRNLVSFIESKTKLSGKEVLEIGCAGGGIVKAFEESGYNSIGVDLTPEYVCYGQQRGVNLRCCHSRELLKENKVYDVIILNHVLEHFVNLEDELKVVRKLLNPQDGVLFVAVPGVKHLLFSYNNDFLQLLQNAHIYNFTKNTLLQVLKKYGFDVIYANEKIEALFCVGVPDDSMKNYYPDVKDFLCTLENNKDNVFSLIAKRVSDNILRYGEGEVAIYGTGNEASKLIDVIGDLPQIRGFLTKDLIEKYKGYPILNMGELQGIKCIVIASRIYKNIIYERIKILQEEQGIDIVFMYE